MKKTKNDEKAKKGENVQKNSPSIYYSNKKNQCTTRDRIFM